MRTEILEISIVVGCVLLWVTSGASIAFGVDRIENHDLHIGGAFFLFLGVLGLIVGGYLFWQLAQVAWTHDKETK